MAFMPMAMQEKLDAEKGSLTDVRFPALGLSDDPGDAR